MPKTQYLLPALALAWLTGSGAPPPAVAGERASDPHILPQGQAVLNYLSRLSSDGPHGIISGQQISGPAAWPQAYALFVQSLHDATGKWVGLLGSEYIPRPRNDGESQLSEPPRATPGEDETLDRILIDQWRSGGLVTINWAIDNPWYRLGVGPYCRKVPQPCVPGSLLDLTNPHSAAGAYYQAEMDDLAANLQVLKNAGVIVLFRPFHEMNGSWFWWGVQTPQIPSQSEFAGLWRYTWTYLTNVKHLNNLLWLYSPSNSETHLQDRGGRNGIMQTSPYYYPGGNYVDVTGLDVYDDQIEPASPQAAGPERRFSLPTYSSMIAFGKPFGLAEFGPQESRRQQFDFDKVLHEVARYYPRVAFFMAWQDNPGAHKYLSIVNNQAPASLMNDPLIITRSEIRY